MSEILSIHVPSLAPAEKHRTILATFDGLKIGDTLLLENDHDPLPLYYEMQAEKGPVFEWRKIEEGPERWKVAIERIADTACSIPARPAMTAASLPEQVVLNVTQIEPKLKHPTIFRYFDGLAEGESFTILNDHDPKPLYYQLIAERGNIFSWKYLKAGPATWMVQIRKSELSKGETIGELAAKDLRKAEVFKRYGIDFCCGGKKSLEEVCAEKGIDRKELEAAFQQEAGATGTRNDYQDWDPAFLADYIYNQHHLYYYKSSPLIKDLAEKIVDHHGDKYPEVKQVQQLFTSLLTELDTHFAKEERVVFPFIKALVQAKRAGDNSILSELPSLTGPLNMMESEHQAAGELLAKLREVTHQFQAPEEACNSFKLLYKKLQDLDEDLQLHIHLENNILFPKALQLEKELKPANSCSIC